MEMSKRDAIRLRPASETGGFLSSAQPSGGDGRPQMPLVGREE
jgi:hypothetical protein